MALRRQWFKPGRHVEQIGKLAARPFFSRRSDDFATKPTRVRPLLAEIAENIGALFSIAISLVLIVAIAALVFAFVKEIRRESIYLDPIDVPEDLAKRGYSPAVVTDRLLDRVRTIQNAASTSKPRQGVDTNAAQVDIQVPGGAISMKALVRYTRSMLDLPEQHLGGEITRDGDTLNLLLRSRDRHSVTVIAGDVSATSVDVLAEKGGEAIVRATDPYVLASYWYDREEPERKFERTLAEIRYVLSHPPATDDPWAMNLWGLVLQSQGDKPAAIVKFRQAIAADPEGSPAYSNLFSVLVESGQREEAFKLLERVAAIPNPSPAVLNGLANGYSLFGKFDAAARTYERSVKLDPKNPTPPVGVAAAYYQLRRYDDAERAAEEAIERRPIPDAYMISLGVALERGRIDDARIRAEQVKAISPVVGALADGYVAIMEHRYSDAVTLFERGVTGAGATNPYAWFGYGRALAGESQYERAIEQYDRALAIMPSMVESLADRGAALAALGRYDAALASFAEAEKIQPRYARIYELWSRTLEKMGRRDDAAAKRAKAEALAKEQRTVLND